jgi:glycosyltransferase involved in cell wall biosynthesis
MTPEISVLMPVYNAGAYLPAAVESILRQTWKDFEVLILDDGSTDGSRDYLATLRDPRVRLDLADGNRGLIATLNRGVELCRAPLVARMDQDDIAEPERLAEQKRAMDAHPEVAILGSDFTPIGGAGQESWVRFFEPEDIRIALLFENPVCHPTVMLRPDRFGSPLYPVEYPHAEDYALWVRCTAVAEQRNLREKLLRYRFHEGQVSRRQTDPQQESIRRLVLSQLAAMGLHPTAGELYVHQSMAHGFLPAPSAPRLTECWVAKLVQANLEHGSYAPELFAQRLRERRQRALQHTARQLQSMPWHRRWRWQFNSQRRARAA